MSFENKKRLSGQYTDVSICVATFTFMYKQHSLNKNVGMQLLVCSFSCICMFLASLLCVCASICSYRQREADARALVEQMNAQSGSESDPLGLDYRGLLPKSPIDNDTIRALERELLRFLSLSPAAVVKISLLLKLIQL